MTSHAAELQIELSQLPQKKNLRREEASEYLRQTYGIRCAPATLAKLVTTGGGPRYFKANRSPLYPTDELDVWAQQKLGPLRSSSADYAIGG